MLKILQARLQQYVNCELPDVQAGFRKGRGTGDQWRNNSRKNEGMEPKQKQYPAVDVTGDRSKVRCCKEDVGVGRGERWDPQMRCGVHRAGNSVWGFVLTQTRKQGL